MKIIFIDPNFPDIHGFEVVFPFGYAYLGAILQREGHDLEYIFPAINRMKMKDVINYISDVKVDLICIGGLIPYLPIVSELINSIKEVQPEVITILGGQMVTYSPELVIKKTNADFCIAGEGEVALLKLINHIEEGKDYSNIPGLIFKVKNQIICNGKGETLPIEKSPIPNWDDFPMDYFMYASPRPIAWWDLRPKRVITWLLSRGCPMKCNFCVSGSKPRYKSIDQALNELQIIVDRFDPDYIIFVDNLFTFNKKYTQKLCKSFIERKFRFKFSATSHASILDLDLLKIMREAGCEAIFYGLECANNKILKFMNKGITVEQMLKAIEITKEAGILPLVSIIFGQPEETINDFFNSLRITSTCINPENPSPNIASIMPLLTFPGTQIYKYARESGFFFSDEEYLKKYGRDFQIIYNDYAKETIGQMIDIARILLSWKFHQSMSDKLIKDLEKMKFTNLETKNHLSTNDLNHLNYLIDRCLKELVIQKHENS